MCQCATQHSMRARVGRWAIVFALLALISASVFSTNADAQIANTGTTGFIGRAVGGISIDADGALANAQQDNLNRLQKLRADGLGKVPNDLGKPNDLRKVSLRGLSMTVAACMAKNQQLPDDVRYLGGLQHVRYVFVYPEENDIVLAGFGEAWKVGPDGTVVGLTTGWPVLLLDDLIVALRSATAASQGGISCSIDQTPEGLRRLNEGLKQIPAGIEDPQPLAQGLEELAGPQPITLTGVPGSSHFARVLVAADYRMKRLGMAFDRSPIAGLSSYLDMVRPGSGGGRSMMPRWWLTTNYDPMLTDAEGLSWELRPRGVKCMAEDDFIAANGTRQHSGKADKTSQKWANNMTAKYEELALHDPIFGELSNCMDLAVIAALIAKENLASRGHCDLTTFTDPGEVVVEQYAVPKQVPAKASFIQKAGSWVVSVSGGVQIHSWGIADRKELGTKLAPVREKAKPPQELSTKLSWRWN